MFKSGALAFDYHNEKLIPIEKSENLEEIKTENEDEDEENFIKTFSDFFNENELKTYVKEYTTPSGDQIVAFGDYGQDG